MTWKNLKGYYVYTYFDENQVPYYVGKVKVGECRLNILMLEFLCSNRFKS